jgi:hypothetical protein
MASRLTADGFELAFLGVGRQFNQELSVYDYDRCIEILCDRDGMTMEEAVEYMEYNVVNAWVGKGTPVFVELGDDGAQGEDEER